MTQRAARRAELFAGMVKFVEEIGPLPSMLAMGPPDAFTENPMTDAHDYPDPDDGSDVVVVTVERLRTGGRARLEMTPEAVRLAAKLLDEHGESALHGSQLMRDHVQLFADALTRACSDPMPAAP